MWRRRQGLDKVLNRALDILVGLPAMILSGLLIPFYLILKRKGKFMAREVLLGQYGRAFQRYSFRVGPKLLRNLPVGLNLVRGDLSLVGPRPLTWSEGRRIPPSAYRRMDVRPGLVSLHRLRNQTNIAFEQEFETDAKYVETAGIKSDLGLVARYVTTAWAADSEVGEYEPVLDILGVRVDNLTMPEALDRIVNAAAQPKATRLCFVNADCMNLTFRNNQYAHSLLDADLVLADGIGLKLAGKLLKRPIIQNVNGTDLFPRLCERLADADESIYLLGGRDGVPDGVAEWIGKHHPTVKIAGFQHGYYKPEEEKAVLEKIRASGARILLVAFGAPRQDLWIQENLDRLGVGLAMGVGGLFDFYSGRIPRAPQWMRELGLEWLFRLIQEPGRMWKRYVVGNVIFLSRVMRYRKGGRRIA